MSDNLPSTVFEEAGAIVTRTSLRFQDPTQLTWEDYTKVGEFLGAIGSAYPFWIGDLLVYGEEVFGEEFAQIEKSLPHSEHTLQNYRWVASKIPRTRRRASLGFGVHETVAALEPRERDRWLDLAEQHGWKREQMREARRASKELDPGGEIGETSPVTHVKGEPIAPGPVFCPICHRPMEEG
jgi:hypothetical protein